jgi:hypothetical protein
LSRQQFRILTENSTRVRVTVEARKIATGDVQPDAVACFEQIAGGPYINRDFDGLAGRQQNRAGFAFAISRTKYPIVQRAGCSIGENINEFGREIRVSR